MKLRIVWTGLAFGSDLPDGLELWSLKVLAVRAAKAVRMVVRAGCCRVARMEMIDLCEPLAVRMDHESDQV